MNNHYMVVPDPKGKNGGSPPPQKSDDSDFGPVLLLLLLLVIVAGVVLAVKKYWPSLRPVLMEANEGYDAGRNGLPVATPKETVVGTNEPNRTPKPRPGLTLGDVDDPPVRVASTPKPAAPAANPSPAPQTKPAVNEQSQPTPASAAPGDFEKALAQAGQRMDALLKQTEELNRTVKLAEKAKTDAQVELHKASGELTRQLGLKDEQINKLEALLDRKSTFPSLRALIDVKKLCLDMLNTQKDVSRDELVSFMTAEIDSQLANLEVHVVEFPAGTPLEKIPGEQVETDRRHEICDDPAKHNQVARMLRPCYYLERDSKRIVVAKALVVLYRFNTPSNTPEAPSTPAN
jgi:hypothetical protein